MISQSSRWSYICMHKVYVGIQKSIKTLDEDQLGITCWMRARFWKICSSLTATDWMKCSTRSNITFSSERRKSQEFRPWPHVKEKKKRKSVHSAKHQLLLNDEIEGFTYDFMSHRKPNFHLWTLDLSITSENEEGLSPKWLKLSSGGHNELSYTCMLLSSMISRGAD